MVNQPSFLPACSHRRCQSNERTCLYRYQYSCEKSHFLLKGKFLLIIIINRCPFRRFLIGEYLEIVLFCFVFSSSSFVYFEREMMESDVISTKNWIYRRFFLSTIPSASRLFCCNTFDGFTFGQIEFDNDDQLICQSVDISHLTWQINQLSWLPNTIFRPSRKQISYEEEHSRNSPIDFF